MRANAAMLCRLACTGIVSGLLLASGLQHLFHVEGFANSIANYRLIPIDLGYLTTLSLPLVHCFVAVGVAMERETQRVSFYVGGTLGLAYLTAQITAYTRELDIGCGCFDAGQSSSIGMASMTPAALLIAASAVGFCLPRDPPFAVDGER